MGKFKVVFLIILALAVSIISVIFISTNNVYYEAQEVYRIYLGGKSIALIKDDKELADYIDNEQQEIKNKYQVNAVYAPEGLEVKKEITYNQEIEDTSTVYEKIKEEKNFTIDGYILTINSEGQSVSEGEAEEAKKIIVYSRSKEIINDAINKLVIAFVDENKYNQYLYENQDKINEVGYLIENVYLANSITIREGHIPVNETIYEDADDLTMFLLFGTNDLHQTYTVKDGDTISSIANDNHLNVNELLVANQELKSDKALLYQGQQLVTNLIDPQITVIEETHNVAHHTINFSTETKEDPSMYKGQTKTEIEGVNGESLLTTKVQKANGQIRSVVTISEKVITPAVNKVVLSGTKSYSSGITGPAIVGDGTWLWPTNSGYTLTDGFSWRWGKMHNAQDIAGLGCNSPIYAAQGGTVVTSTYQYSLGNYIEINHNNGYLTLYAHLSNRYVSVGTNVTAGQVIGTMGNTGESYGCHLHFGAKYNGVFFDPMRLY